MRIMFSAGEVSGDLHGAMLAREIKKIAPDTELFGFGGNNMEKSGVRLLKNFAGYNIMGVWEVIKNLRRILRLLDYLTDCMKKERPDLLVLIDYPDFNWRLAARAKKFGIPVFSYIPPSAWAWRKGRAKKCAAIADEFVAVFPFETKVYEDAGAKISFLGNPLTDTVKPELSADESRKFFAAKDGGHIVLLLPGSRRHEISMLLPDMLEAAKIIKDARPDTEFFLPAASGSDTAYMERAIKTAGLNVRITHENRYSLMSIADAAIATSGTVVMEAAILGLPCVILYKMSKLSYIIGKIFVRVENISLPNILLKKRLQPEFLQDEIRPEKIAAETLKLFRGEKTRDEITAGLADAVKLLGEKGAARRIAEKILNTAKAQEAKEAKLNAKL